MRGCADLQNIRGGIVRSLISVSCYVLPFTGLGESRPVFYSLEVCGC